MLFNHKKTKTLLFFLQKKLKITFLLLTNYFCFDIIVMLLSVGMFESFKCGGIAQLARASALHAEGRRFESDYLHHIEA